MDEGKETRGPRGKKVVICMQEEIQGISDVQEEDKEQATKNEKNVIYPLENNKILDKDGIHKTP